MNEEQIQQLIAILLLSASLFFAPQIKAQQQCDPPTCTADLNCDAVVGTNDLLIILEAWGLSENGDLDGNGATGSDDLIILLSHYGTICANTEN
jgi:hypothetical protein